MCCSCFVNWSNKSLFFKTKMISYKLGFLLLCVFYIHPTTQMLLMPCEPPCGPGYICRSDVLHYKQACQKHYGFCGFGGRLRCEPDELCLEFPGVPDQGVCIKDPDYKPTDGTCKEDKDCFSDEKCIHEGFDPREPDAEILHHDSPRKCIKEPKWCLIDKHCRDTSGERCVGVSQDCFQCAPTAGYT